MLDFWTVTATQAGTLATLIGLFYKVVKDVRERRERDNQRMQEAALWRAFITSEMQQVKDKVEQLSRGLR